MFLVIKDHEYVSGCDVNKIYFLYIGNNYRNAKAFFDNIGPKNFQDDIDNQHAAPQKITYNLMCGKNILCSKYYDWASLTYYQSPFPIHDIVDELELFAIMLYYSGGDKLKDIKYAIHERIYTICSNLDDAINEFDQYEIDERMAIRIIYINNNLNEQIIKERLYMKYKNKKVEN